jgi:hypothetical protein
VIFHYGLEFDCLAVLPQDPKAWWLEPCPDHIACPSHVQEQIRFSVNNLYWPIARFGGSHL